jgi:thiol:disulfide interchange protein DsbA
MCRTLVSIVLLTLSVVACGRDTASNTPPTAEQKPAPARETQSAAPAAQTAESQQATAAQESVSAGTPEERGDASLERLAAMPSDQQLPEGRWKAGTNYKTLVPPQPTNVPAGKVEVVEVFWYGCPHCNVLEPYIASWLKNKPDYIELVRLPVMWGPAHKLHAKLFYTLEALGRPDLHQKVFEAIHNNNNPLVGKNEAESLNVMVAFVKTNGIDEKKFKEAWSSFGVASNLQRAQQLTLRYHVEGVPLFVVNGKYTTDVGSAGGTSKLIELVDDLAASEKRR